MYSSANLICFALENGADAHPADSESSRKLLEAVKAAEESFIAHMDDDLNSADAITDIFNLVTETNKAIAADDASADSRLVAQAQGIPAAVPSQDLRGQAATSPEEEATVLQDDVLPAEDAAVSADNNDRKAVAEAGLLDEGDPLEGYSGSHDGEDWSDYLSASMDESGNGGGRLQLKLSLGGGTASSETSSTFDTRGCIKAYGRCHIELEACGGVQGEQPWLHGKAGLFWIGQVVTAQDIHGRGPDIGADAFGGDGAAAEIGRHPSVPEHVGGEVQRKAKIPERLRFLSPRRSRSGIERAAED